MSSGCGRRVWPRTWGWVALGVASFVALGGCAASGGTAPAASAPGGEVATIAAPATDAGLVADPGVDLEGPTAPRDQDAPPPDAAPDAAAPCLWTPDSLRAETSAAWGERAGCYLAAPAEWTVAHIVSLRIVSVEVSAKATTIRFVLLNAAGERLTPPAAKLRFEVELKKRKKGSLQLAGAPHRDGIYTLTLGSNAMPKPCRVLIRLELDVNAAIADVVDEWRPYGC